ncbi:helix-turn-helix domain-containing protein [Clostridium butyricum]|uniref:helix-turn-helix domain-containing protein n=1 Tax=Clostridium butyricum TaxID=1492 RepID=UPI0013D32FD7|nr:helix-turn-helix transcriptional regulator [Clostridium butyricum]MCQ2017311.1 helix-turn-helix domain-containing protein [Clostridium butyricum]MCQ2023090.1 helix-turn-helix domain-containing protein [Clostridium butyricum]NFB73148.1 XRE family transcriptional regulator [Clostridium butyricum]NFB92674.1 XRE family transcriptional regulator [Clostridium butyricum]UTY53550.1 helix-turn-helix transcriptional regulator [Clostridium butyricum]
MIRRERKKKKLKLSDIAKELNVSESYISKLETHPQKCNPTINIILKLSKVLGLCPIFVFIFFIKHKKNDQK